MFTSGHARDQDKRSAAVSVSALSPDVARLAMFNVVRVSDPAELDSRSRVSDRLPGSSRDYRYQLRDRALWRMRFDSPIFSIAIRSAGAILASHGEGRFATEVSLDGEESDVFGFTTLQQGDITLVRRGDPTTATSSRGLAYRFDSDTRLVTSDDSVRTNVFVKVAEVEQALEQMLDQRLRTSLEFRPSLDWSCGLAASLQSQLDFVMREFGRPDGIADNVVALAATTDLLLTLILRGASHNYADQVELGAAYAVPAYVRRAEEFMRVHCAAPIRVTDIAAAAGCSVRTLGAVFRHSRGRTPLAALHAVRLEQVHCELSRDAGNSPVGAVARGYGFTNASRFVTAFRRRFGETPLAVVRRASRR
jgi:AraC-like DNA-binding protein